MPRTRFQAVFEELFGEPKLPTEDPFEKPERGVVTNRTLATTACITYAGKTLVVTEVDVRQRSYFDEEEMRMLGKATLRSSGITVAFKVNQILTVDEFYGIDVQLVLRQGSADPLVIDIMPTNMKTVFTSRYSYTEIEAHGVVREEL